MQKSSLESSSKISIFHKWTVCIDQPSVTQNTGVHNLSLHLKSISISFKVYPEFLMLQISRKISLIHFVSLQS